MNKEQLKQILDLLFESKKEDDKIQKASKVYFELISDDYAPILDWKTYKLIEILKILDKHIYDWTYYFLYDAESFYPNCEITCNYEKINISNEEEAKEFILWLI